VRSNADRKATLTSGGREPPEPPRRNPCQRRPAVHIQKFLLAALGSNPRNLLVEQKLLGQVEGLAVLMSVATAFGSKLDLPPVSSPWSRSAKIVSRSLPDPMSFSIRKSLVLPMFVPVSHLTSRIRSNIWVSMRRLLKYSCFAYNRIPLLYA